VSVAARRCVMLMLMMMLMMLARQLSVTLSGTGAETSLVVGRALGSAHQLDDGGGQAWKRIDGRRAAPFHSTSEPEGRDRRPGGGRSDAAWINEARRRRRTASSRLQVMRLVINACLSPLRVYTGATRQGSAEPGQARSTGHAKRAAADASNTRIDK